jgi:hypothetical protein
MKLLDQDITAKATEVLISILSNIPFIGIKSTEIDIPALQSNHLTPAAWDMDIVLKLRLPAFDEQLLIAEVKKNGQPRYATMAVNHLLRVKSKQPDACLIFIAPFIYSTP